jgi:hypothetical protein
MSVLNAIQVERTIVHIVDHLENRESVFSNNELPLSSNERLRSYFEGQISNALTDAETSQAVFAPAPSGEQTPASTCRAALNRPDAFISSSQDLARALLASMGTDERIKPGNLAVCIYMALSDRAKHLALLKLDPSETLVQKIEADSSGNPAWVNFEVREDAMPTARERLQKAAFIFPERTSDGCELLLLDRQTSKTAADFFAHKFLKASALIDVRKRTKLLYDALVSAHHRLTPAQPTAGRPSLGPEEAEEFLEQIYTAMHRSSIHTPDWLESLPIPADAKALVESEIRRNIPVEKEFPLDPDYARQELIRKRRVKGAYGVVLEVETEHWGDVVKEVERKTVAGKSVVKLLIEIADYKEVRK